MNRKSLCSGKRLALSAMVIFLTACNATGTGGNKMVDGLDQSGQQQVPVTPDQSLNLRAFCPKTVIRAGTETYRTFESGVSEDDPGALNTLRFQATVTEVARECNYSNDQLSIRVGVKGRVINGPTGAVGSINTPIRVAVADTANQVIYSKLHQVLVTIPEGASTAKFSFVDSNIVIPVPEKENLLIYVGFDEGPPASRPVN